MVNVSLLKGEASPADVTEVHGEDDENEEEATGVDAFASPPSSVPARVLRDRSGIRGPTRYGW